MRIWLSVVVFLSALGLLCGQDQERLNAYIGTSPAQVGDEAKTHISSFLDKLNSKSRKSDRIFLRTVFSQAHREFLKNYEQYAGFSEIFPKGHYDCVTATALYSLLLDELGYAHSIYETKYHVFLLIDSPEGQFLIESTDPINGFEYQPERIKERIAMYTQDQESRYGQLNSSDQVASMKTVTQSELTGLLYYNQCVKSFNEQQYVIANTYLSKAKLLYDSPRMKEMEFILLNYIASSSLELSTDLSNKSQISQRQEP